MKNKETKSFEQNITAVYRLNRLGSLWWCTFWWQFQLQNCFLLQKAFDCASEVKVQHFCTTEESTQAYSTCRSAQTERRVWIKHGVWLVFLRAPLKYTQFTLTSEFRNTRALNNSFKWAPLLRDKPLMGESHKNLSRTRPKIKRNT